MARICYLFLIASSIFLACNNIEYAQGKKLYEVYCSNCHMKSGEGLNRLIPPLTDKIFLRQRKSLIPCSIKYGVSDTLVVHGRKYSEPMPSNLKLTDSQITNIMNYLYNDLNDMKITFSSDNIRRSLNNCR